MFENEAKRGQENEAKRGQAEDPARWSEEGPTVPGLSPGLRVLLAEDDVNMREQLVEVLNDAGYEVTVANDGVEMLNNLSKVAVWPFRGEAFDVVITDHLMPGCTGLDALARIRNMGYVVPAVLITASPDQDVQQRANRLKAKVLTKPFDVTELHEAVDQVTLLEVCAV